MTKIGHNTMYVSFFRLYVIQRRTF